MWYEYVPTVIAQKLSLPLKETVPKVDGRKEFGKSAGSAFDRGADHHPRAIGIGWTRVRVENDEDSSAPKS